MPAIAVIGDDGTTGRPADTFAAPARKPGGSVVGAGLIAEKKDQETQRKTIPRWMALLRGRISRASARCTQSTETGEIHDASANGFRRHQPGPPLALEQRRDGRR